MGSGKSTVGQILAEKLNTNFVDFDDQFIERQQQATMSESEIFNSKGEILF